jgi:hypothetical protein
MKTIHLKNTIRYTFLLMAIITALFGCNKLDKGFAANTWDNTKHVSATIMGQVIDDSGKPLDGALVKIENYSYITKANGIFIFSKINTAQKATKIAVTKGGFFKGFRTLLINEGKDHYTNIKMQNLGTPVTFNSIAGAIVNVSGGGTIQFAPNSFMNKTTGLNYSGLVSVYTTRINPTDADIAEKIPGSLMAVNAQGEENVLQSYGMVGAEIYDASGNALQLNAGNTAEIISPIDSKQQATAPAEIQLWSLNETNGMWIEEGKSKKVGNNYVSTVGHFSYWNNDYGGTSVTFDVTLIDQLTNAPLSNFSCDFGNSATGGGSSHGYTNSNGFASGPIPDNSNLFFHVYDNCGNLLYSQAVTTTTSNISLGTISIAISNAQSFNGTILNCSNNAVSNGFVMVNSQGPFIANSSGVFNFILTCSNLTNGTIIVGDLNTSQNSSYTVSLTSGQNALGNLAACGVSNDFLYMNFSNGGINLNYTQAMPGSILIATDSVNYSSIQSSFFGGITGGNSYILANGAGVGTASLNNWIFNFGDSVNNYSIYSPSPTLSGVNITYTTYSTVSGGKVEGTISGIFTTSANSSPANTTLTANGSFSITRP